MAHESGNRRLGKDGVEVALAPALAVACRNPSVVQIGADRHDALLRNDASDNLTYDAGLLLVDDDLLVLDDVALAISNGRDVVESVARIATVPPTIASTMLCLGSNLLRDVVRVFRCLLGGLPQLRTVDASANVPTADAGIDGVQVNVVLELVDRIEQFL